MRPARGCDTESNSLGFQFDPSLRRCPWSQIDSETQMMLGWFMEWRDFQALPWPGGIMDQPAFVFEALQIVKAQSDIMTAELQRAAAAKRRASHG